MVVNNGDIFEIAGHIIACGDSLDRFFVSKVVNGRKIRAVISDPPYGVAYVENKKGIVSLGVKDAKVIVGDQIQSEYEYIQFTKKWTECILPHLDTYNTFHIFNSDTMFLGLRTGMQMANIHFSQMLIWLKNQPVMGMKDYLSQFEVIAYGWYGKYKMERSKAKSVIYHPKPRSSKLHPTQKPVGLIRKIIPNVTKINDYVYDAFLGSGTTAVACEHLGRKCIGIELDPEYVTIILSRLEKLTKQKAVKRTD
jgi:DNA modification methylase